MKIIFENKQSLLEDKVVKFNNEMYPKFGWCVILMGGGGSGKGTVFKNKVPIEGEYYNPDDLKELKRMWKITNKVTGRPYEDDFKTPEEERNMKNPDFVGELHTSMDRLSKSWKKQTYTTTDEVDRKRLPNIIFDITGKKIKSIDEIVHAVKPVGYKVAIIWVLTSADLALENNSRRSRTVEEPILISTHLGCMDTAEYIFNSGYINKIDNFWVVDTAMKYDAKTYHKEQNVYEIPTTKDGLKKFDFIVTRLANNRLKFTNRLKEIEEK